ncbi:MAG: hypothetical protein FJ253_09000 [Phycisphaerae bacterium]|nr:hypothetical protein [Phycisphaerae bacterium]
MEEAQLTYCPFGCPADLNGDGTVDGLDLGLLLGDWGDCPPCPSDFNGDLVVDGSDLGDLLSLWGPCPPEPDPKDLVIDLDADTDRNDTIDDADEAEEDGWTTARGALFLVNCDNDDGQANGKLDGVRFDRNGAPKDEDFTINGADDEIDITPLVIRPPGKLKPAWRFYMRVHNISQLRAIHLFPEIKAGATSILGKTTALDTDSLEVDITDLVRASACRRVDRVMGFEGLKFRLVNTAVNDPFPDAYPMLFAGLVDFTLEARDTSVGPPLILGSDTVRLKVAPWIMVWNHRPSLELYAMNLGASNADFRDKINTGSGGQLVEYATGSRWAQDDIEIGYSETPRSRMHVTGYTLHHGSTFEAAGGLGFAQFMIDLLLKEDHGIYRMPHPGAPTTDDQKLAFSLDYGGNLELMQAIGTSKLGRICYGNGPGPDASSTGGMSKFKVRFLDSQEVQPTFGIDTSWLNVGHVDEYVSFWKPKGGDGKITVIVASPQKALDIVDTALPADAGPGSDPGLLFGLGAYTWGVATSATPNTLTDLSANFENMTYEWIRIYDGPGKGQIAHIDMVLGPNTLRIDQRWGPTDPTKFVIVGLPPDDPDATGQGLDRFYYDPPKGPGWNSIPPVLPVGPGSAYVLMDGTLFNPGPPTLAAVPFPPNDPAAVTMKEVKDDFADFRKLNTYARDIIAAQRGVIEAAAGGAANVTFIEVPVLYTGHLDPGPPEKIKARTARAWTPGAANIQYGGTKLLIAKQRDFKGGTELFKTSIDAAVAPSTAVYPDDWAEYHNNTGEVHCGSNALREFLPFKWWNPPAP